MSKKIGVSKKKSNSPHHPPDSRSSSNGGGTNGYAVGYRRPPLHTRFRPGKSGNPAGRRKGLRNLRTDVQLTLKTPVKVKEGGRTRKISTQEGALWLLRAKTLKGDARALDRVIELAARYNNEPGETVAQALSTDDQEILAAYADEILSSRPTTGAKLPSDAETNTPKAAVIVPMPSRPGGPLKRIKLHRRPETSADDKGHK
jgi:hypothetical protein